MILCLKILREDGREEIITIKCSRKGSLGRLGAYILSQAGAFADSPQLRRLTKQCLLSRYLYADTLFQPGGCELAIRCAELNALSKSARRLRVDLRSL